eukprot:14899603-Alexandrium_andersonii.AAC.1
MAHRPADPGCAEWSLAEPTRAWRSPFANSQAEPDEAQWSGPAELGEVRCSLGGAGRGMAEAVEARSLVEPGAALEPGGVLRSLAEQPSLAERK